ncbi:MAG: GNAT family protein [Bryobacteraceae bacterium]|jgi:ribosomal-protein-serine acetyltransferase
MEPVAPRPVIRVDADLELRPVRLEDAADLFAAIDRNRERLRQWLPWVGTSYSREDVYLFIAERERENQLGTALTTTIWKDGVLCGSIGLHKIDFRHRSTSIGYWIDGEYEGRGIVLRACRAIVTEGFRNYGLHRIEIRCATGNQRSGALPRKLGFVEEGILREAEWLHDHWVDLRVFSMLEQDWA